MLITFVADEFSATRIIMAVCSVCILLENAVPWEQVERCKLCLGMSGPSFL